MTAPLVSICLPNLNNREFLEERMETILAQTVTDWELIICDGYSNDGAWEFFQKFGSDARIRMSQLPRGIYQGWNHCLKQAHGEFIYIATSDDTACPELLEKLVAVLKMHPDVDMATCNFRIIDETGRPVATDHPHPNSGAEIYGSWLDKAHRRHGQSEFVAACVVGPVWTTITSALIRRSLFDKTGLFTTGEGSIADFEWGLRACLFTDTVHLPEALSTWRRHPRQATTNRDTARSLLRYQEMITRVFHDYASRIPPSLRQSTATPARLAQWWRVGSYNSLKLHPRLAWDHPSNFITNLRTLMSHHRGLALGHLLRGGRWKHRPQVDLIRFVDLLLDEFQLPPICHDL